MIKRRILFVASFTDAWIETVFRDFKEIMQESHLLQMRGLKQIKTYGSILMILSHLLQMRGLKPIINH